jgi:hypothetical protein
MLSQVYEKGSLKNTADGFELLLKNNIDSATLVGVGPLMVDGTSVAPTAITLQTASGERPGDQITYRTPLFIPVGSKIKVAVASAPLAPGGHRLELSIIVGEAGRINLEVADQL